MFRRKHPPLEQRPRQLQIADLRRMHPSVIAHPDGKSFDLPVHTATTRRLPDEFPVLPPTMTVSVVGITHRLLSGSTVVHPQLSNGWDPLIPLGGLVQGIVMDFVNRPPSILAEMAGSRPPAQQNSTPRSTSDNSSRNAMPPGTVALPPVPQEIEELKTLSPQELSRITTDEVALDEFVQKLPLWTAIQSLRESIEHDVTKAANEHLECERQIEQFREEIVHQQAQVKNSLARWDVVHDLQKKILARSSPATLSRLLQDKADRMDVASEQLHDQYIAGSIPEDDFIKQYRQQRSHYHRLMVYSERLLNQR